MLESPDAVLLYIPLMKDLGMSWNEIKEVITKRQFAITSRLTAFALYLIYNNQL